MKRTLALLLCTALLLLCAGCAELYDETDFLGKTSARIAAEYGPFDLLSMPVGADGLYRSCTCGYTLRETKVGFLGTSPEVLLLITFDANGVAVSCEEGFRPGG